MKKGYLSQYFEGVAVRTLTAVEIDGTISHQNEFQGDEKLRELFGAEKTRFHAKFLYLNDDDTAEPFYGRLTWYDARKNQPHRTPEYRFYYSRRNPIVSRARIGDTLLIAKHQDDSILAIIIEAGTTIERQVLWMFGFDVVSTTSFEFRQNLEAPTDQIGYSSRLILEQLGIEIQETGSEYLDEMVTAWKGEFPTTKSFSDFARRTTDAPFPMDDPDLCLMKWMEWEEILFRRLERYQLKDRIQGGFDDVDEFISFSLSIQNRRKSRVGHALENHLEAIFNELGIRYGRNKDAVTENNKKPDFLFPGKKEYDDPAFDVGELTMLGAKSTCKDRWRQVVTEANRIATKHLLTLEAAISLNQTNEMQAHGLQLVIPKPIHISFAPSQQDWILTLSEFTKLVADRQSKL